MKENEQSRFIRWGVPGWMMLLAFVSFILLDILLSPSSSNNSLVGAAKTVMETVSLSVTASAAVALLVAAAGIPLGFVIYQVYFYIRWNSPFSRDGLFPPFIVGRGTDLERTMIGISSNDIVGNDKWRKDWVNNPLYETDHGLKWRYIENFFTEIIQYIDSNLGGLSLHIRYRYLMDLMHTLGAGLFGVYLGFFGYVFLKVKTDDISLSIVLIVSLVCLVALVVLLEMEDKIKREDIKPIPNEVIRYLVVKPFKVIEWFQLSNPSAIYLIFLFTFLYLGSPSPYTIVYTQDHLVFRIVVLAFTVGAWWFSKRKYPSQVIWSEVITLTVFEIIAFETSQLIRNWSFFLPEWWNIGWSILFFLITNMIFVKNRQNTRDDLIAMQNYTMKRYFTNSIKPFYAPQQKNRNKKQIPKIKKPARTNKKAGKSASSSRVK